MAASVDSHFTHLAWVNTPRKDGGLGNLSIPLLSDMTHKISIDYGVYLSDVGHSLRYIIHSTNNYLPNYHFSISIVFFF